VIRNPRTPLRLAVAALVALVALAGAGAAMGASPSGKGPPPSATVYTQTNDPAGNRVQALATSHDGRLSLARSFPTGGMGTGGGLGNQGAVVIAGTWLLAVNAGSDELSLLRIHRRGLALRDIVPSGGAKPISVTSDGRRAYVLNAGASSGVTGFAIDDGRLTPIPGSTRPLSGAGADPAQVELTPDGKALVVTEKATNRIGSYPVAPDGSVGPPTFSPSAGETPFGFAFDHRGRVFVSEAFGGRPGESAVSSYALSAGGGVTPISPAVATHQTAACWVVVTPDGRFAYTTNTGSDSISGYRIAKDGSIALLDGDGLTATTGDGPTDMALGQAGRVLFALDAAGGSVHAFGVGHRGGLEPLGAVGGLPAGAVTGLAAR
jgi:6-phosphogluconolactonase